MLREWLNSIAFYKHYYCLDIQIMNSKSGISVQCYLTSASAHLPECNSQQLHINVVGIVQNI